MKILEKIFRKKKPGVSVIWLVLILLLSLLGVGDTLYLVVKSYAGEPIFCDIYSLTGCHNVLNSVYSKLFGANLSVWGLLYYLTMFSLTIIFAATIKKRYFNLLFAFSIFGFLFSMRLVYLQVIVLQNLCLYCMVSALISTLIFIVSAIYFIFKMMVKNNVKLYAGDK